MTMHGPNYNRPNNAFFVPFGRAVTTWACNLFDLRFATWFSRFMESRCIPNCLMFSPLAESSVRITS